MIPYYPQPSITLGTLTVHAFGICAAAALLVGYVLVDQRSSRYGLRRNLAGSAYLAAVIAGLPGGVLWARLEGESAISVSGLAVGGLVGLIAVISLDSSLREKSGRLNAFPTLAWMLFRRADRRGRLDWRALDLYAFALPFVLTVARLGCFLAHDHVGNATRCRLGVLFPGGTRFDLGLLYAMASAITAGILTFLSRRPLAAGIVSLSATALLASSRLAILPRGPAEESDYAAASVALLVSAGLAVIHPCLEAY